jgi:hypothetical protein
LSGQRLHAGNCHLQRIPSLRACARLQ